MICDWDQKILGYHFSIVQRSNKIMTDVNALTIFRKFISQYYIIASILYSTDKLQRMKAYEDSIFTKENIVKITSDVSQQSI